MNTSHSRKKWLRTSGNFAYIFGIAFLIASLFTSLIPPTVASAHHAVLNGSASCQSNGTYVINWSIKNWSDVNGPMTITGINRSIGVSVGTQVDVNGVSGSETVSNQAATITLTVSASWTNGNTSTNSGSVKLKGDCYPPPTNTPTNTATNTPDSPTNTPTSTSTNTPDQATNTPTNTATNAPNYQLNLSHIACVDGKVEIHFVLLNIPDGITPGTLTYTYGSISPTKNTGNVWHYFDYQPDGFYNVTSASVSVGGTTVTLHNPGTDSGTYDCTPDNTPTRTHTFTPTNTPENTSTGTITPTDTPSNTPTNTPTDTPTNTPTNTPTSTSVNDPFDLEFFCMGFRIISLNNFESSYAWSINGGPSGSGSLPALGYIDIPTDYYPGLVTLYVGEQLMESGYLPDDCDEDENTPTPPATTPGTPRPTNTPTQRNPTEVVKTLIPDPNATPEILIPVTGVDLAGGSSASRMLFNLGIGLLGLGLVLNGLSRNRKDMEI